MMIVIILGASMSELLAEAAERPLMPDNWVEHLCELMDKSIALYCIVLYCIALHTYVLQYRVVCYYML